jgi:uncharacterized membrane protein YeaQ/YmgE (transglycosylase-associated protein family)
MENILLWILVGLIAAWFSSVAIPGEAPQGIINNFSVGVVGAVVGGSLYKAGFEISKGAWLGDTSFALIGALVLLLILKGLSSITSAPKSRP